eukprot:659842_1
MSAYVFGSASDESKKEANQYEIWTRGYNGCGQQLNGTTETVKQWEMILNIKQKKVKAIHSINESIVIVYEDGDMSVGGWNSSGQLGVGSYDSAITQIHHLDFKVNIVSKGIASKHVFVIKRTDGKLYSVGRNKDKQCGVETGSDKHNKWIHVPMMKIDIKSIATGYSFTVFLCKNGTMYGCGKSDKGALGMGPKTKKVSAPTIITTHAKIKAISAGGYHCVAITIQQRVCSWGSNAYGGCGQGSNNDAIYEPTLIDKLSTQSIKQVECGWDHTLLVGSDGVLFAFGYNEDGECGDGTTGNIFDPKRIRVGENEKVESIKCGAYHNVLTTTTNKIFVWGWNDYNQCLVNDDKGNVLTPTLYTIPEMFKHRDVQVIPGYLSTRISVCPSIILSASKNKQEIVQFLLGLGLERYVDAFREEGFETIDQLEDVTNGDLKELGVTMAHRKQITKAIEAYFVAKSHAHDDDDDGKDDTKEEYDDTAEANKPIKRVDNAFVMFLGFAKYTIASYKNLNDIHLDERCLRETFVDQFGYRFESNEYKDKTWTKAEALRWIRSKRDEILIKKGRVQYNALIFCGASHGSTHAMICSDGQKLDTATIRSTFAPNVNDAFQHMPKVFIFNCCRTPFTKVKEASTTSSRAGSPAAGYGMTMTGTEGNLVFGAKLSSFVAAAFSELGDRKGLYDVFKHAHKKAKSEMGLALQEHDPEVDDVIFQMKPQSRGAASGAQSDGTTQIRDDDLWNILAPYEGSMDLLAYLDRLRAAGFTTNATLRTLTKQKLESNNIKMTLFQRKALLKRIATLKQ